MVLACTISSASAAGIERVEPPNWWVGFQHPQLELLVYGEDVGTLSPSVDWPGISVDEVITTGNPNYLFVRLDIGPDTEAGEVDIVFEGADGTITHAYSLNERNQDPDHTRGFSSADAIYLITPDRFANGDPDNDQIEGMGDVLDRSLPRGRHGGDLRGIIDRLDYIAGLGFTAVWLNPVLENAMPEFSYHGYSTTDFYRVDPRKGSNEDLAELARAGREKGVGLIMDMIVNHSGLYHWWMDDPPMDDWVHRWDGYVGTTHAKSLSVDPYGAEVDRREFYDGWFVPSMPDLNQDNPLRPRPGHPRPGGDVKRLRRRRPRTRRPLDTGHGFGLERPRPALDRKRGIQGGFHGYRDRRGVAARAGFHHVRAGPGPDVRGLRPGR